MAKRCLLPLALVALALAMPFMTPLALLDRLVFAAIYGIAGLGVGLLLGQCHILNLAQAVFYGIGAYASAWLGVEMGLPPVAGFAAGMALSALIALAIGWQILWLQGYFLALATLALGMIGTELFFEWDWLTGGTFGIGGIAPISLGGFKLDTPLRFYYLAWGVLIAACLLARNLLSSRMGLATRALRDAPEAAAVMGVEGHHLRVKLLVASAMLGSLAGSLFAHHAGFVSVQSFGIEQSIQMLLIPVVGGAGSVWGIIAGALFVALMPEALSMLGEIHHVLFGLALVAVVMAFPEGLAGVWNRLVPQGRHAAREEGHHVR